MSKEPSLSTLSIRLDGDPILCDLRDCLSRYQAALLSHPQESPGAHLQEAHFALLPIDAEVLQAAYPLPFCVVDNFADRPLNG